MSAAEGAPVAARAISGTARGWSVLLTAAALFATGCLGPLGPRDLREVVPAGQPLGVEDPRLVRVLEGHAARVAARQGLAGTARVALSGPDFKLNRPQRIAVARPGRLRFEVLGLFDQLAAILATDGESFGFFDASTGETTRGRVTRGLLWDLAQIDLAPEELVGMLLAAPMPEAGTLQAGAWLLPDGGIAVAFGWPTGGLDAQCAAEDPFGAFLIEQCFLPERTVLDLGGQLFVFDGSGALQEVRGLDPGAVVRYRVFFEEHEVVDAASGRVYPMRMRMESPASESVARFDWKQVRLGEAPSDRVFQLPERNDSDANR